MHGMGMPQFSPLGPGGVGLAESLGWGHCTVTSLWPCGTATGWQQNIPHERENAWLLGGAGLGAAFPSGERSSPSSLEQGLAWHHCCLAGDASSLPRAQPGCSPITLRPSNIQQRFSKAGLAKSIGSVPCVWGRCLAQPCFREHCFARGSWRGGQ